MNEYGVTFTESLLKDLTRDVISALTVINDKGYSHNDIKPDNILYKDGNFVLVDYDTLTKYNIIIDKQIGTDYYISPEIYKKKYVTKNSDIWSLEITLYALFTEKYPFNPYKFSSFDSKKLENYDVSREFIDLIKKMLTTNSSERISLNALSNHKWLIGCRKRSIDMHDNCYNESKK